VATWDAWDALLADDDPDPLEVLRLAGTYRRYLQAVERQAAVAARAAGHSWEDIGQALGVRRQAAWQRLRDRPPGRRAGPIVDLAELARAGAWPHYPSVGPP